MNGRSAKHPRLSIAFVHPDLGLGGAERLVVDAAVKLAERGHEVTVLTAFHDPQRCFKETVDGSFGVTVAGGWFPRSIFGKALALCAYIRCTLVACYIAWVAFRRKRQFDIVIADQVSVVVPLLHMLTSSKVLFYCHHPDLLLAQRRPGLHRWYRVPLDWLEEVTTGQADCILVNSAYTQEVFERTFTRLHGRGITLRILHPAVQVPSDADLRRAHEKWRQLLDPALATFLAAGPVFLSINRFERKKDVGLAVRAFSLVASGQRGRAQHCKLVLAGGYDPRLTENREYFAELQALVAELGLQKQVRMLPSFSDHEKAALLAACTALLYTPVNEHFGIVPLEAMAAARPVIACNSGGPKESVIDGMTGFLCAPEPSSFAAAMKKLLDGEKEAKKIGDAARLHVQRTFSRPAFGSKLQAILENMLEIKQKKP